jgi:tetratricopeptide (TPR) repeat protein
MKHIIFRLKSCSIFVSYLICCIIIIAGSYTTSLAQQTCATKGNYPLPEISQSARNKMQQDLNLAIANLEKNSNGLNELIWAGRRTAYLGNYYESMDFFSKAIALHPESAEPYRHRGHRWITLRCYDKAISDLTIATDLTKGKTDVVELDGMPNDKNIPTSTLQSNIWYHLGLAYYLTGDYNKAVDAFKSCFEVSTNPDMFIATANWYNNSLRKAGRISEADVFLKKINPNVELIENHDYLRILKLYIDKQEITDPIQFLKNEAGLGAASYGYGLGVYLLFKGEKNKANLVFNHILSLKQWGAFGYIAAEAEKKTEIQIIGVIHSGNKNINYNALSNFLVEQNPDIILWEQEDEFKRVFGLLTAYRLKIARPTVEQMALQKLTQKNKSLPILGFDTLFKSKKDYIKKSIKINDSIHEQLYHARLTVEDSLAYDKYAKLRNETLDQYLEGTLSNVNSPAVYEKEISIREMEKNIIAPLADKYVYDKILVNEFKEELSFWIARNDYMVKRILEVAKNQNGKKIIVLTGLAHKFYLVDKLKNEPGISLN